MEEARLKTGIYGGSFNPIHIGHLAIANYLCEYTSLDELWLMITPGNPLKENINLLPDTLRLKMVSEAIADYPKMKASDFEFHLPRPSYTLHTLEALQSAYPQREFFLIIGADNWKAFPQWHQSTRIINQFSVYIYPRRGYTINPSDLPKNVTYIDAPLIDISSTFIREGLSNGKDLRFFLPCNVNHMLKGIKF